MVEYTSDPDRIDWQRLRDELISDDFHNDRTIGQLRQSFANSAYQIYALDGERCIGTARALSDGVCNCYVVDVWTQSAYRERQIATTMMNHLINCAEGQHIYLFTDDAVDFYTKLGFSARPVGLELVAGEWLQNDSRELPD